MSPRPAPSSLSPTAAAPARGRVGAARLVVAIFLVALTLRAPLAAVGPSLFGALRDATGGFGVPWAVLLVISAAQVLLMARMRPGRRVEG